MNCQESRSLGVRVFLVVGAPAFAAGGGSAAGMDASMNYVGWDVRLVNPFVGSPYTSAGVHHRVFDGLGDLGVILECGRIIRRCPAFRFTPAAFSAYRNLSNTGFRYSPHGGGQR